MDEIQELTPKTGVREAAMEKTAPEGEDLPAEKGMLAAEKLREEEQAAENPAADWKAGMTQEEAKRHVRYMKEAIKQAKKAYALGEVPIGCVIVHDGRVIGRGYNRRNTDKNTLSHAEITAIRKASKKLGDWRLEDCALYVTLEP